jgi:hypothetical protein
MEGSRAWSVDGGITRLVRDLVVDVGRLAGVPPHLQALRCGRAGPATSDTVKFKLPGQ